MESYVKKIIYTNIKSKGYKIVSFFIGVPKSDPYERSADILSHSIPDMVRTMESYVSRDRMARGDGAKLIYWHLCFYIVRT